MSETLERMMQENQLNRQQSEGNLGPDDLHLLKQYLTVSPSKRQIVKSVPLPETDISYVITLKQLLQSEIGWNVTLQSKIEAIRQTNSNRLASPEGVLKKRAVFQLSKSNGSHSFVSRLDENGLPVRVPPKLKASRTEILGYVKQICANFSQSMKTTQQAVSYAHDLLCFDDIFSKAFDDAAYFKEEKPETPQRELGKSGSRSRIASALGNQQKQLKFTPLLIAVTASLMASKFSEIDDNLMIVSEMLQYVHQVLHARVSGQSKLSYQDVTRAELQALERFNWDAFRAIMLDFVEIYFQMAKNIIDRKDSSPAGLDNLTKQIGHGWRYLLLEKVRERTLELIMPIVESDWSYNFKNSELALAAMKIAFNEFIIPYSQRELSRSPVKLLPASLQIKKETPLTAARRTTGLTSSSSGRKFAGFSGRQEARRRRHQHNQTPAIGSEGHEFLVSLHQETEQMIHDTIFDACGKQKDQLEKLVREVCRQMGEEVSDTEEENQSADQGAKTLKFKDLIVLEEMSEKNITSTGKVETENKEIDQIMMPVSPVSGLSEDPETSKLPQPVISLRQRFQQRHSLTEKMSNKGTEEDEHSYLAKIQEGINSNNYYTNQQKAQLRQNVVRLTSKTNARTQQNPSVLSTESKKLTGSGQKPNTSNLKKYVNAEVPKEGRASMLRTSIQTISCVSGFAGPAKNTKTGLDESIRKSYVDSVIKLYDEDADENVAANDYKREEWLNIQVEDDPDEIELLVQEQTNDEAPPPVQPFNASEYHTQQQTKKDLCSPEKLPDQIFKQAQQEKKRRRRQDERSKCGRQQNTATKLSASNTVQSLTLSKMQNDRSTELKQGNDDLAENLRDIDNKASISIQKSRQPMFPSNPETASNIPDLSSVTTTNQLNCTNEESQQTTRTGASYNLSSKVMKARPVLESAKQWRIQRHTAVTTTHQSSVKAPNIFVGNKQPALSQKKVRRERAERKKSIDANFSSFDKQQQAKKKMQASGTQAFLSIESPDPVAHNTVLHQNTGRKVNEGYAVQRIQRAERSRSFVRVNSRHVSTVNRDQIGSNVKQSKDVGCTSEVRSLAKTQQIQPKQGSQSGRTATQLSHVKETDNDQHTHSYSVLDNVRLPIGMHGREQSYTALTHARTTTNAELPIKKGSYAQIMAKKKAEAQHSKFHASQYLRTGMKQSRTKTASALSQINFDSTINSKEKNTLKKSMDSSVMRQYLTNGKVAQIQQRNEESSCEEGIDEHLSKVDVVPPSVFHHNSMVAAEMYHPPSGQTPNAISKKNLLLKHRAREKSTSSIQRSSSRQVLKTQTKNTVPLQHAKLNSRVSQKRPIGEQSTKGKQQAQTQQLKNLKSKLSLNLEMIEQNRDDEIKYLKSHIEEGFNSERSRQIVNKGANNGLSIICEESKFGLKSGGQALTTSKSKKEITAAVSPTSIASQQHSRATSRMSPFSAKSLKQREKQAPQQELYMLKGGIPGTVITPKQKVIPPFNSGGRNRHEDQQSINNSNFVIPSASPELSQLAMPSNPALEAINYATAKKTKAGLISSEKRNQLHPRASQNKYRIHSDFMLSSSRSKVKDRGQNKEKVDYQLPAQHYQPVNASRNHQVKKMPSQKLSEQSAKPSGLRSVKVEDTKPIVAAIAKTSKHQSGKDQAHYFKTSQNSTIEQERTVPLTNSTGKVISSPRVKELKTNKYRSIFDKNN